MHTLMLSNDTADELIQKGWVEIDGVTVYDNCILPEEAEVRVNSKIERERKELMYLKFNKPPGYESSLSDEIEGSIASFFEVFDDLAIAGRLDKQSEGLMLLSNDGKWVEHICNPSSSKEKEYLVVLDREADEEFFIKFRAGINIGEHTTLPCYCEKINGPEIRIVLTEGKNRQIRKMCRVLGYKVLNLKRIRIAQFELGDLEPGHMEFIDTRLIGFL